VIVVASSQRVLRKLLSNCSRKELLPEATLHGGCNQDCRRIHMVRRLAEILVHSTAAVWLTGIGAR